MRLTIIGVTLAALSLTGCATKTVYVDRVVEVKVPVTVPCKTGEPDPVQMLKDSMTKEEWDALTTDQRDALIAAQALAWRTLSWQTADLTAGCR